MPNLPPFFRIAMGAGQAALLCVIPLCARSESDASQSVATVDDGAFVSDFSDLLAAGGNDDWYIANFVRADAHFRTAWSKDIVRIDPRDGALVLEILPTMPGETKDFIGSQVQRNQLTHYGRYEIVMQAAKGEGIISSMYTYTGPYFGDPHDEIDFEFLGRDTTKVWINRFADGQKMPGEWVDLGFDAGDAPHHYAFEWREDSLTWFVDGREFYRIDESTHAIPTSPGKIHIDIWAGAEGQRNWSGVAPDDMRTSARYYCMSYRPLDSLAPTCALPEGGPLDG